MLINMELKLETQTHLRAALSHLEEATQLCTVSASRTRIKENLDQAMQSLGLAKITAKDKEQQLITDVREELRTLGSPRRMLLRKKVEQFVTRLRKGVGE